MAVVTNQEIVPCNGTYTETFTATAGSTFTNITLNGTQVTIGSNVVSASLNGVPIVTNPPFPCDTIEISYPVGQTNNTLAVNEVCDTGLALISFHFRGNELTQFEYSLTESLSNAILETFFGVPLTDYTFEYKSSLAGTYTTLTATQFVTTISTAPAGAYIRITYIGSYDIDQLLNIKYSFSSAQTDPNLTYTTIPIDQDLAIGFHSKVVLANITALNSSNLFVGVNTANPSSSDWTIYPNDILTAPGLTAANTQLSTLMPPYALRLFNSYSGANVTGAINAKVDIITEAGKLRKVTALSSNSDPEYRLFNNTLSLSTTDYVNIGDFTANRINYNSVPVNPLQVFDPNKNFSVSCWVRKRGVTSGAVPLDIGFAISINQQNSVNFGGGNGATSGILFGISEIGLSWYVQDFGFVTSAKRNIWLTNTFATPLNEWYHLCFTYQAPVIANDWANASYCCFYNGRKITGVYSPLGTIQPLNFTDRTFNTPLNLGSTFSTPTGNSARDIFVNADYADFFITDTVLDDEEIRIIYNRGTNILANYGNYPTDVINNMIAHYTFDTPAGYTDNTPIGFVRVNDISTEVNNGTIVNQGATPVTVSFY